MNSIAHEIMVNNYTSRVVLLAAVQSHISFHSSFTFTIIKMFTIFHKIMKCFVKQHMAPTLLAVVVVLAFSPPQIKYIQHQPTQCKVNSCRA